ncbi:MAG: M42 family metallopeptidase [Chloroflexota bacterium]
MFDLKAHLKSLVEAHAPSGHEGPVRDLVREAWTGLVDSFEQDGLGSLIGIKRGTQSAEPRRKIMVAAHMDEIGLMVRDVVDGFLYVHRISGVDNRVMLAQPVLVHGRKPLPGVVAATPPHLLKPEDRTKYPAFDELIVDVGLPAEEVAALVRIGDLITPDVPMVELLNGRLAAKAFDDRACVAALTECLHTLSGMYHQWDVVAVATVQEENGLNGARTATYHVQPDIAIALDVTFAPQPGVDADETCEIGGGPGLGIGPNFHPKLVERIRETARRHEIKLQDDVIPGASGTDAWAIQIARDGVPTALLEIPLRSMHSPVEMVDLRDIERLGRLLAHFIAALDVEFMSSLQWDEARREEKAL